MDKNVASDVADNICESVGKNLEGKNLPSFSRYIYIYIYIAK